MKVIQNEAKASNWEFIRRERGSQKFFLQLHPLHILVGFLYALGIFVCSYYPNDRKAINGSLWETENARKCC